MKITEYDGSKLRLILIGMITDTKVCSRISNVMNQRNGPRFDQPWADLIAKWCRDHLKRYDSAPNGRIGLLCQQWAESTKPDPATLNQVETLLDYLSKEHTSSQGSNSDYILDLASEYFNKHRLRDAVEAVQDHMEGGKVEAAFTELSSTARIELGYSNVINPIKDLDVWLEVFNEERRPALFEYPGALGQLVGPSFTRNSLFAFMGVEKAGKSFFLLDAAFRALKKRYKVAYFEVGDLGKEETIIRLGQRIERQSFRQEDVEWPVGWQPETDIPTFDKRTLKGVSVGHVVRKLQKYTRGRDLLKIICHPNSSINVEGIAGYIQDWVRENGWIPDVVVIDYADILALPFSSNIDPKDQIDETWKQLRKLSQTFNCLVLTATQAGSQAYRNSGRAVVRSDFSGRKTKLAHANGILGLTFSAEDTKYGVRRINWTVRRAGASYESQQVVVAGCLAAGMPIVLSKYATRRTVAATSPANGSEDKK